MSADLEDLPVELVWSTDEAARVVRCYPGWVRLRFVHKKRNRKPALYGVANALRERGVDAMVRADGDRHVLIARVP